ncbi:MAG: hypothetical protein KDB27_01820, partial [Planctomycetales bacterium]|nr:hypothetical protein [Planctomycetales bacterium]
MESEFLFVCCQVGAEPALKSEIGRNSPNLRFAFSRPGFVTFKNAGENKMTPHVELRSVFARTFGLSLGRVEGDNMQSMAKEVCEKLRGHSFEHLHV